MHVSETLIPATNWWAIYSYPKDGEEEPFITYRVVAWSRGQDGDIRACLADDETRSVLTVLERAEDRIGFAGYLYSEDDPVSDLSSTFSDALEMADRAACRAAAALPSREQTR